MKATKAFISYSWSSPEHENWVLDLATRLRESGVDAILDKWDLKEGQEANAFMEKMVSDEEITKVIIVSDKAYAEKSNLRKGGAGTEAQIISKELYEKEDQNKFVALVAERDDEGEPYLPTYYTSRKYIDFSDKDRYTESFEQLLRWIEDKPSHKKPEIGKLPSYLTDEESSISLATNTSKRRAHDSVIGMKEYSYAATREYFELFGNELEKFRWSIDIDPLTDEFMANFDSFTPYRDECLDVIRAITRYTEDQRFLDLLHSFFERLLQYTEAPENVNSWRDWSFDNYKFFCRELFLHCGVAFIAEGRHDLFNILVERQYYMERNTSLGRDALVQFTDFNQYLKSLEYRNGKLQFNRLSLTADMIKERSANLGIHFRKLMEVDFILFLRAELGEFNHFNRWWPETLVYLGFDYGAFEMFDRSRSARHFEKVRPFLGNATKKRSWRHFCRNMAGTGETCRSGVTIGSTQENCWVFKNCAHSLELVNIQLGYCTYGSTTRLPEVPASGSSSDGVVVDHVRCSAVDVAVSVSHDDLARRSNRTHLVSRLQILGAEGRNPVAVVRACVSRRAGNPPLALPGRDDGKNYSKTVAPPHPPYGSSIAYRNGSSSRV